jgi:threonylcarbamoyladenosine tRNA methylthiotransferase MtaB
MSQKRVKFSTLGCRLNQYETQAVREQFLRAGYVETRENRDADVFVLNTCTVTGESDRESRYQIRRFHRDNPDAQIVVTGCYVERDREEIEALEGVSLTVLNREKSELLELFESCTSLNFHRTEPPSKRRFAPLTVSQLDGRSRAHVKVQDGCNHACSFCKVVLARGPSRSRALSDVVEEVKRLTDQGYKEVVLTGVQLGAYGLDLKKRGMLPELIEVLSDNSELNRVRLSSIEPTDVTPELIETMAKQEKACPHLHIPLQSGSDTILKEMNRRYQRGFYRDLIGRIRSQIKDFVLTADVMVGFPGETEPDFQDTIQVLTETEPYKLHIFPYSRREGTRAARLTEKVSSVESKRRKKVLFELEQKLRRRVQDRFQKRALDVLVEESASERGWASGRSAHYLQVRFQSDAAKPGEMWHVETIQSEADHLVAKVMP